MQKAMSHSTPCWHKWPLSTHQSNIKTWAGNGSGLIRVTNGGRGDLKKMVKENALVVLAKRGCCMSHVVNRLLHALGANPTVYEVEEIDVDDLVSLLAADAGGGGNQRLMQFPAVFIGGRWFGGLERIIATHITEELTPLLKQAGALWL